MSHVNLQCYFARVKYKMKHIANIGMSINKHLLKQTVRLLIFQVTQVLF